MIMASALILAVSLASNFGASSDDQDPAILVKDGAHDSSPGTLELGASATSGITVYFFWAIGCSHCTIVKPYIDSLEQKYPQVTFLRLEISQNADNRALYSDFNHRFNVQHPVVPSVFVGDNALIGEEAIQSKLEPIIVKMLGGNNPPAPTKPGAPTSLSATPGDGQVQLTWKAPSDDGGAAIDYYVVYQNGKDVSHVKALTITLKGLSNGVSYSFSVAAHNSAGIGTKSSMVSATPTTSVQKPGAPTALKALPGDGQVQLSWEPPATNGGAAIDYYVIYRNGQDVGHVTGTMKTVTGLTNGITYNFAIAAHNSAGTGAMSNTVDVMPSMNIATPGPPTNITATAFDGQVLVSWNPPVDDGGSAIIGYTLTWTLDPNGTFESILINGTSFMHEGLENGVPIYYRVYATNAAGEGEISELVMATPLDSSHPPLTPIILSATFMNGNVSLTWTAPVNDVDNITSYNIYRGMNESAMELISTTPDTEYVDSDVQGDLTYYYQVRAMSNDGEGDAIGMVNITIADAADQDQDASFFGTIEGQLAILGLATCGIGMIGYVLWKKRQM